MTVEMFLLVAALIVFIVAACGVAASRINLLAAGAALAVAAVIAQNWP